MSTVPPSEQVRFGAYRVDLRSAELFRHGIRIKIQEQPFQILTMLLERPGEVVSREELRQRLWSDDTFVDFDAGLNAAIRRLRDALHDSAEKPRYVETLTRRGYRFIGAVETLGKADAQTPAVALAADNGNDPAAGVALAPENEVVNNRAEVTVANAARPTEAVKKSRHLWVFAAAALVSLVSLVIVLELHRTPAPPSRRTFVLPPAGTAFNLIGDAGGAVALSPDGAKLAFVAVDAKGRALIWVRALGKLTADPLDGTEGATFPFWSADGRWIGYFADAKLKKIPSEGGQPIILCDAIFGRGGSWNSRGEIIFAPTSHSAIYRVPDSGGTPAPVTTVDTSIHTTHRWPRFLPDGRHFTYLAASHFADTAHSGVYLASLDDKQRKLVVSTATDVTYASGYLFFLRDGVLLAQAFDPKRGELKGEPRATVEKVLYDPTIWKAVFDTSESGVMAYQLGEKLNGTQLRWFDRAGRELGTLGDPVFQFVPRLSRDGRKLAVGIADGGYSHLWVYDLVRKGRMQITFSRYDNGSPVWMPDDTHIFLTAKRQHYGVYEVDVAGAQAERLIFDRARDAWPLDVSPDGRYLLYAIGETIGQVYSQVWICRLEECESPFRLSEEEAVELDAQFSPEGQWVAYTSNRSGRHEVYVLPSPAGRPSGQKPSGKRWQISLSGGLQPRWRRDGKELFYVDADNTIVAVPVMSRGSNFTMGTPRPLFRVANPAVGISDYYDVTPDGSKFIVNTAAEQRAAPITLVENWTSDLRK